MAPPRHRLFFALVPPPAALVDVGRVQAELLTRFEPGGRPTSPELQHITLVFLGEFAPESEAASQACAAAARVNAPAFELALGMADSFPGTSPPWLLRPSPTPPALLALHDALAVELQREGFAQERRGFVPHLTLLRHARRALQPTPVEPIAWVVQEFVLLDSWPEARQYHARGRWPLPYHVGLGNRGK